MLKKIRSLKVEIRDQFVDVKFMMGIFGRILQYQYNRYFCQSIDTISIPILFDISHH